ncbi:Crp/Fnr family transcriptional regulator [Tenacibaculum sp. M341]|uniref:Crp/Fnr family transcriptional regulator n=1 Tax=Tenacibaculum sp. M341 TaxID=2530339 RepID=UPI00104F60E1|nr:Crp/Fnr family transcriptional regulator [Tenacibaculum sp. M341]TCI84434.1 Crp/Fnr family transcriptional regulator [Tenacibaculum sp. M341]
MKIELVRSFSRFYMSDISDEGINAFADILEIKYFKKGDVLIKRADDLTKFYILKSGIVASFSEDIETKKEYIRTIHVENYAFTNLFYLDKDKEATYDYFKCLTDDCLLLEGSFQDFLTLTQENHEISLLYNYIQQKLLLQLLIRLDRLSLLDATNRYRLLKQRIPNIDNLIPQYQIASYLNITPVQLSRIRKKMYSV